MLSDLRIEIIAAKLPPIRFHETRISFTGRSSK